jgi:hypothetical protein
MAKEFKDYDKMFAQYRGTALEHIRSLGGSIATNDVRNIIKWPFGYKQFSNEDVRFAVYEADDFLEWQKFRVMLKGVTTREKLYALGWYLSMNDSDVAIIRVNNYIGALKRGGLLNDDLEVVR